MKTKKKSKQAKNIVKCKNVIKLEYLILIYFTKLAFMYLACLTIPFARELFRFTTTRLSYVQYGGFKDVFLDIEYQTQVIN